MQNEVVQNAVGDSRGDSSEIRYFEMQSCSDSLAHILQIKDHSVPTDPPHR